jgi:hypothetical protein
MTQLAIRKGWIKPLRWATDKSPEAIADAAGDRPLTIKERVEMAIGLDVIDGDPRVRGIACKTAVVMERQNQIDEHHDHPAEVPHVHSGVVGLSVVRQELLQDTSYLEYLRARAMDGATVVPESGEAEAIRTVA